VPSAAYRVCTRALEGVQSKMRPEGHRGKGNVEVKILRKKRGRNRAAVHHSVLNMHASASSCGGLDTLEAEKGGERKKKKARALTTSGALARACDSPFNAKLRQMWWAWGRGMVKGGGPGNPIAFDREQVHKTFVKLSPRLLGQARAEYSHRKKKDRPEIRPITNIGETALPHVYGFWLHAPEKVSRTLAARGKRKER